MQEFGGSQEALRRNGPPSPAPPSSPATPRVLTLKTSREHITSSDCRKEARPGPGPEAGRAAPGTPPRVPKDN